MTVKGRRQDAERELTRLLGAADAGSLVEPSNGASGSLLSARIDNGRPPAQFPRERPSATASSSRNQIEPYLGAEALQKLARHRHRALAHDSCGPRAAPTVKEGIAARTIGHAHRVLCKALNDAVKNDLVSKNVCKLEAAPKVDDHDIVIVQDVSGLTRQTTRHPFSVSGNDLAIHRHAAR